MVRGGGGRCYADTDRTELFFHVIDPITRVNDEELFVQLEKQRVPARADRKQSIRQLPSR